MRVLAENMQVSMPTISGIVDRLAQANYVKRIADETDRRQVKVELTKQGREFIARFQQAVSERWQEVLKALGAKDIESFYRVVTKLKEALQNKR